MTTIKYTHGVDGVTCNTPCPHDQRNEWGVFYVNSGACERCRFFHGAAGPDSIDCNFHPPSAPCSIQSNRERDPEGLHGGRDGRD